MPPCHRFYLWPKVLPGGVPYRYGYFLVLCDREVVVDVCSYISQAGDEMSDGTLGWVVVDLAAEVYPCSLFVLLVVCSDICFGLYRL